MGLLPKKLFGGRKKIYIFDLYNIDYFITQ